MSESGGRRLARAALLSLGAHLAAGLAMAFILRHGLETNPDLADRMRFLANNRGAWTAAWLTWSLAALSILYFCRCFVAAHRDLAKPGPRAQGTALDWAVPLAMAAVCADLAAQVMELTAVPYLAGVGFNLWRDGVPAPQAGAVFLAWHRKAVLLTGFLANGLYTLMAGLLAWSGRFNYPRWVGAAGVCVVVSGTALSAAALAGSASGMFWSNVVLVPSILAWQAGVAMTAADPRRHQ